MPDELNIKDANQKLEGPKPTEQKVSGLALIDAARDFHLFTLGPVYVGACLDVDLLKVFSEQEHVQFESVLLELPFKAFDNINEWNTRIQGIEKKRSPSGAVDNSMAHLLAQFLQGWEFVRRETRFYSRVYTRPVQLLMPGTVRGTSVEVYMLCSNKGTQTLRGANPYIVEVDPAVADHVKRDADVVLSIMKG